MKPERIAEVWPEPADRKVGVNARLIDGIDAEALPRMLSVRDGD